MLASIMSWIFGLLTSWYIWMPIVAVLAFLTYRNHKRAQFIEEGEHTLLILEIPKANDKQELAAEQMFASLHGILRDRKELAMTAGVQEHISFEIAAIGKHIRFYVWVPKHLQNFLEGQVYAQYPTVQIHEAEEDYTKRDVSQPVSFSAELVLTDNEVLPIKTFQSFEVDPLAGITATLAKLETSSEEMWIQVMARPIADDWHRRSQRYVSSVKSGGGGSGDDILTSMGGYILQAIEALWRPPENGPGASGPKELSERDKTRISEAEKKGTKLGYQVKIRMMYLGEDEATARQRMQAIVGTFKQFNSTNLNGFSMRKTTFDREKLAEYSARLFHDKGFILNIEELASVFHLPHTNVETPNIVWASNKTAEPPAMLPVVTGTNPDEDNQISAFGLTNFRGINHQFGLYRSDRSRHIYVIGQTGAGKSGLLELFALSDIFHNQGYAIIDPHGDLAVNNMRFIPENRVKDVVYFNPADTAHPIGFNPMEVTDPNMRNNISSEIIGVLKRMFADSWGPRLEYILRYTILALLYYPNSTMLDITRMLTDKKFREEVLVHVEDTVVLNFWRIEFASWNDKFASEAVAPVLNKVGAFTANPIIRNIIGQPRSTFNIREIMDEGKILIVNLSKGLIGEDNAGILGAFIVTKIQLAAMSRSDIPNVDDRRPFFLYVDEFQNFATDSFATILSEARKYGLNLTVANQYISQMSETVRDAVFGNVGTTISFRVSADDAPMLSKQFEPQFEATDILQMHNRHFVISMVIKGEKVPAFSATTLMLPPAQTDNTSLIIDNTRHNFAAKREDVQEAIRALIAPPAHLQPKQSQNMAKKWPIDKGAQPAVPKAAPEKGKEQRAQLPLTALPSQQIPATTAVNPGQVTPDQPKAQEHASLQPQRQDEAASGPSKKRSRSRSRSRNKKSPEQQRSSEDPASPATPPEHAGPAQTSPQTNNTTNDSPPAESIKRTQPDDDTHELRLR